VRYLTAGFSDITFTDELRELNDVVMISLFTDRRANSGDLPTTEYQYGWWADTINSRKIGSRLYLLKREKITDDLIPKVDSIVKEALQWILDDKIATEVQVSTLRSDLSTIQTQITLIRNGAEILGLEFDNIWKGL